ncbi:MAG: tRNA 2-thiouridine(34) synthase MnmA, partial [Deltaproteobacteria bacterium]|nr:tRNA 2-thiouridine(34) synthase MnmA [Deltaproteobacteria bacterium]
TPNPCVACNTFIKFDELSYYAKSIDADYFATGHYAKIRHDGGQSYLEAAADPAKDQSYFLMGVSQENLNKCLFPIGDFSKDQIRDFAREAGLPVCEKADSMEVCFIPENNYRKFLEESYQITDDPGDIISESGEVLGKHKGIHHFTVGQRKGLPAHGLDAHYVIRLESETKRVIVGLDKSLFSEGLSLDGIYFERAEEFLNRPLTVKIRSRSALIPSTLVQKEGSKLIARFETPQRAVTPGQFAVFYDRNRVVGGGPILKAVANF